MRPTTKTGQSIRVIIRINKQIRGFWRYAYGWASDDAADLLGEARLDRQVSLSYHLAHWCKPPARRAALDGHLILAWTTLGSLVEGSMKFFLCVFLRDYKANHPNVKVTQRFNTPDGLALEPLKVFFAQEVWDADERKLWFPFVERVQQRRNAIHSYKDREIGTLAEFRAGVRDYAEFLIELHSVVPYPDAGDLNPV